jgi:hypothetical protein
MDDYVQAIRRATYNVSPLSVFRQDDISGFSAVLRVFLER